MSPFDRWYPVPERYISYVAARVDDLGGDSKGILPSPNGVPVRAKPVEREYTGKVKLSSIALVTLRDLNLMIVLAHTSSKHEN